MVHASSVQRAACTAPHWCASRCTTSVPRPAVAPHTRRSASQPGAAPAAHRAAVRVAAAAAAEAPEAPTCSYEEGADVLGTVVWAGPKGAKVELPDGSVGFMPSREGPFVIRDALEERAPGAVRDVSMHVLQSMCCCMLLPA